MEWEKLLNPTRLEDARIIELKSGIERSEYQKDYDRILFSSAFRRMQDKTQVFPVPESDFIHSRLTHSLEVSSVARSLGNLAGQFVIEKEKFDSSKYNFQIFGDINAAAALAHDIGNPPFGHSGEYAIRNYFKENINRFTNLNASELRDFTDYEGNAHGFRLITNHHPNEKSRGLMITSASLAAFTKYPVSSNHNERGKYKASKKFGYFQTEKDYFEKVAELTGLKKISDGFWARHPLAFLIEAADNICYRIIDLEDGFKLKYLEVNDIEDLIFPLIKSFGGFESFYSKYSNINDDGEKIGYLRAKSINVLVNEVIEVFKENYSKIMNGEFNNELTKEIESVGILEGAIKDANIELYNKKEVLEIEFAGYKVISNLLDNYINAIENPKENLYKKLLHILPDQFKLSNQDSDYIKIMKVVDYVARMTDSFALNFYKKLNGFELSRIK